MKLISDEEIEKTTRDTPRGNSFTECFINCYREVAQAQLDDDKEKVREIFERIRRAAIPVRKISSLRLSIESDFLDEIEQKYLGEKDG